MALAPSYWTTKSDEELLNLRLCDLSLSVKNSPIYPALCQLRHELAQKDLRLPLYFWFSTEWFTPDGCLGIALPFYMGHERLLALEKNQMGVVEGGTWEWCLRILRHEVGHVVENAFFLRRKKERQRLFGLSSQPYPESYKPRPYSRRYVVNLGQYYAQAHSDEDFAETFAVWLSPTSCWQKRYRHWPVWEKLMYVDRLMKELRGKTPPPRPRWHPCAV